MAESANLFTEKEIGRFKKEVSPTRRRLAFVALSLLMIVFISSCISNLVQSWKYASYGGIDMSDVFAEIKLDQTYQGSHCLARERLKSAIYYAVFAVITFVVLIIRKKQEHWMKQTLQLISSIEKLKNGT